MNNLEPRLVKHVDYPIEGENYAPTIIHLEGGAAIYAYADFISIGYGTKLSPKLRIGFLDKPVERFVTGDHCRLFGGTIASRNFVCGDYVTIHDNVWAYGRDDILIGHNSWFGMRCTLDAEGGFSVGNGFGAGQDTHLWSHIRHGDVMEGCRYLSFGKFIAHDDVWFVGRCTSGPAEHMSKSIALTESNVTRGMAENSVYGGNPAVILNEKIGKPYDEVSLARKQMMFQGYMEKFLLKYPHHYPSLAKEEKLFERFDIKTRTYKKMNTPLEVAFMRFLLPEVKFVPKNYPVVRLEP